MGKPKSPAPPDPKETSAAQTGTNVSTAIANNTMGMVDQYGPYGSQTSKVIGYETTVDPYTGKSYQIPRYATTTTLNEQQQKTLDQTQRAQTSTAELANIGANNLKGVLGERFNPQDLPERGQLSSGDFSEDRQRVEQAILDRMRPSMERDREAMLTRLANQGINLGSEAYSAAQGDFGQTQNDARLGAILAGGQEQSRMFGMDLNRAQFQDGQRGRALDEQFALRNQPINEVAALMSGSQVSQPNFSQFQPQMMPTTDNAGLINQNFNQKMQNYQQEMGQYNNLMGGLFGLGSAGITAKWG